jgi:hypothetical protein
MAENFIVKAAVISLAAHSAMLFFTYVHKINDSQYKATRQKRIEISYKPTYERAPDIHEYPIKPAQALDLNNNQRFSSNGTIPVSVINDKQMLPFGMMYERKPQEMRAMELSRKESITPIKSEKINNPVYAAYNEMVRERIKERVYANYDRMERGSVYLTFLVDAHGRLEVAKIIPEKTNASQHLQDIALRSLHEASPFPPFLKGMSLTEYPFNIQIQYQVSD